MNLPLRLVLILLAGLSSPCYSGSIIQRENYRQSVVAIYSVGESYGDEDENDTSRGSGLLISNNGHILTSLHVVQNPELYKSVRLNVYFYSVDDDGRDRQHGPFEASVIATNTRFDLAVIQLNDLSYAARVPPIPLASPPIRTSNERVAEIAGFGYSSLPSEGYPAALSTFKGNLSSPVASDSPLMVVNLIGTAPGASGGPGFRYGSLASYIWHGKQTLFQADKGIIQQDSWFVATELTVEVFAWLDGIVPALNYSREEARFKDIVQDHDGTFPPETLRLKDFRPRYPRIEEAAADSDGTACLQRCDSFVLAPPPGTEIYAAALTQEVTSRDHAGARSSAISVQYSTTPLHIEETGVALFNSASREAYIKWYLRPSMRQLGLLRTKHNLAGRIGSVPFLIPSNPGMRNRSAALSECPMYPNVRWKIELLKDGIISVDAVALTSGSSITEVSSGVPGEDLSRCQLIVYQQELETRLPELKELAASTRSYQSSPSVRRRKPVKKVEVAKTQCANPCYRRISP